MKSRSILFTSLFLVVNLFIAAVALLIACSNTDEFYTVEVVDGVRTVHNIKPLWGDEPMVELEFVQQIGSLDETDENLMMYFIWDVERDEDGNIYILDSGNVRIQKFDRDGNYLTTIGKEGDGPGEFRSALTININKDGNIIAGDLNGNKIIIFDENGAEIRRIGISLSIARLNPFLKLLGSQYFIIGGNTFFNSPQGSEDLYDLYTIVDYDGKLAGKYGEPTFIPNGDYLIVDAMVPFEVDDKDEMIFAYRYSNNIIKFNSAGNKLWIINRPVNYELGIVGEENGFIIMPNVVSMGIGIDKKQRIWVLTLTEQPEKWDRKEMLVPKSIARFELFDSGGILLGYVPVPQDIYRMRIKGDRLLIVEGQQVSVYEYRIVER